MQLPFGPLDYTRMRFVENEIDLAHTFLDLSEIEANESLVAEKASSAAQEGYRTALTYINTIRDADDWRRLMARIFNLKERLDLLSAPPPVQDAG